MLLGLMLVLTGGFVLIDPSSSLGGFGDDALLAAGIGCGVVGLRTNS